MFRLGGAQHYGINAFEVREVLPRPSLLSVPQSHPVMRGIVIFRGKTISVMDLSMAIGGPSVVDTSNVFVIIPAFSRNVQGVLAHSVERIVNFNWQDIVTPRNGSAGSSGYLTAVTHVDGNLVEVIDVERELSEVTGTIEDRLQEVLDQLEQPVAGIEMRLVVDDSLVAGKPVCKAIEVNMSLETE